MDEKLLHILQHSLGVDQYGQGRMYRNHFVAGPDEAEKCRQLVTMGFMKEYPPREITGGDPLFTVTPIGIEAVLLQSPKPPKLTRSQMRYRQFLKSNVDDMSFGEWLKAEKTRNRMRDVSY